MAVPEPGRGPLRLSDELQRWLGGDTEKTLGGLVDVFEERSFAILFIFLLGITALPPLPTGGVTHVSELIAMLLALQLIANRDRVWLPARWRGLELARDAHPRFVAGLMNTVRRLERISRPRLRFVFGHRLSNVIFGALVIGGSLARDRGWARGHCPGDSARQGPGRRVGRTVFDRRRPTNREECACSITERS